ncbi:MAG: tetratricopeptide repeat protein [Planctomycetota bacterium]
MQEISLKDAATDIVQTSRSWFDDDQKQVQRGKQQFFVIAGAGVSYPSIPLSREITEHCKQKAIADGRDRTYTSPDPINEYEHWMNAAYSQPDSRRQYFQTLIDEARISHATLRLVQLLDSHRVTDFVVTPNFDNLISRGLTRFGVEHIVCDHGATTQRIIQDRDDAVQIVHVHGSHWNYDICNLSSEIEHVAGATNPLGYPTGMLQLMQGLLASMSPIVVGYAGWENDVIMSALKDRCFVNDWRTNLYWCCYKREDADALPEWLKDHPRARLVMPDAGPSSHGDTGTGAEADAPAPPTGSTGGQPTPAASGKPATLDAAAVFEAIIERLNLNEPKITADPLSLFLEQLTADFPDDRETTGDDAPAAETDEFSWQSTIAAVKRAIALAEESDAQAKADPAEEIIDELRSALRRSQPQEIPGLIKRLGDADGLGKLDAGLKDSVASELMDLLQRPGRTPESLTAVVEAMKRIHDGDHPDVAKGLNSLAYVMQDLGRAKEAEPISVQSLEMYKRLFDGDHPDIARGLNNVAYVMQNLGRAEEAEPIYRQALEMRQRLFDGDHPDIARGLNNVAYVTNALGRAEQAEPIYRQALEMYKRLF